MDVARKRSLGEAIIEGGLFDYLYRLVITDIKPPVFYRIKENPEDYKTLSKWVLNQLTPRIMPLGEDFTKRMGEYLMHPEDKGLAPAHPVRRPPLRQLLRIQAAQVHQPDGPRTYRDLRTVSRTGSMECAT